MKTIKMIICILFLALSLSNPVQAEDKKRSPTTPDDTVLILQAGKKPTPGIHVYDANGKHLGLAIDWRGFYHPKTKSFVRIDLDTGNIRTRTLYFESADCTGQALIEPSLMYNIYQNCGKYYTGERIAPSPITISSEQDATSCECRTGGSWPYWVPAVEVTAQTLGFTIPIALPLEFNAQIKPLDK